LVKRLAANIVLVLSNVFILMVKTDFLLADQLRYSTRSVGLDFFGSYHHVASISVKYRAEYLALRGISAIVRWLPRQSALTFGRIVGRLSRWVLRSRYQLAKENMSAALPELSDAEMKKIF